MIIYLISKVGVEQCKAELEEGGRSMQASDISKDAGEVEKLLNSGEGCQLGGHLVVNKVAGNFHIGNFFKLIISLYVEYIYISNYASILAPGVSFQQNHMVKF